MPTTENFQSHKYQFLFSDMSNQNSLLPPQLISAQKMKQLLRNTSVEVISSDIVIFSNVTISRLIITLWKKKRYVQFFSLQNCSFFQAAIYRLCFAANRYLCS